MLRVAVVEDVANSVQLIRDYVMRFGGESGEKVEVTLFSNGMDIAEEYHPVWDIILLDVEMPLLDGLSAAERIRQSDPALGVFVRKGSLKKARQQLPQQIFVPCNSCYLVNLRYVTVIHNNMAVVAEQELAISRPKRKEFLQRLTDYVGGGCSPSCADSSSRPE